MKAYWGVEVQVHSFLILALHRDEWLTSHPGHPHGKDLVPTDQQDEWDPEGVWMLWREKSLAPAGN